MSYKKYDISQDTKIKHHLYETCLSASFKLLAGFLPSQAVWGTSQKSSISECECLSSWMQQPQMSRFAVLSASPPATCITLVCSCTSDAGHTWHNEIRMYKAQVLYPQNLIGMIPTGGTSNCWDVLLCSMFASMYSCFKKWQSESVCKQSASPLPRIFQVNPSLHLPASLVVRAEGSAAPQTPES